MRGLNTELHRPVTVLSKPIDLAARPSGLVEARQSKPDIPSWDKETSLHLLSRYLAARPSGLVEARGVEPLSENPSIQLSPGALCHLNFPSVNAGTQALTLGSHFMRDLFNGERQMHVHRYMTLSPEPRYSPEERAVL